MKKENPVIISINSEKAYSKIQHPLLMRSSRSLRRDLLPTLSPCQVHSISTPSAVYKHRTPRREAAGSSLLSTCTHRGHTLFATELCPMCTVILCLCTCFHTTNYLETQWPQTVTPTYHLTQPERPGIWTGRRGVKGLSQRLVLAQAVGRVPPRGPGQPWLDPEVRVPVRGAPSPLRYFRRGESTGVPSLRGAWEERLE